MRAAEAIRQVVDSGHPPRHLLLGAFALHRFRSEIERFQTEIAEWESVTLTADFPDDETAQAVR